MTEMKEQRRFDWGPPVKAGDNFKEFLVYVVIVAILGFGTWFLLNNRHNRKHSIASNKSADIVAVDQKLEKVVPKGYEEAASIKAPSKDTIKSVPAMPAPKKGFLVQIGAFGDEPSANEIFTLLKNEGIEATLLQPDEQFEIYRLVVGPYADEKEAESKAEQLNAIDFPCFVVEAQ